MPPPDGACAGGGAAERGEGAGGGGVWVLYDREELLLAAGLGAGALRRRGMFAFLLGWGSTGGSTMIDNVAGTS